MIGEKLGNRLFDKRRHGDALQRRAGLEPAIGSRRHPRAKLLPLLLRRRHRVRARRRSGQRCGVFINVSGLRSVLAMISPYARC